MLNEPYLSEIEDLLNSNSHDVPSTLPPLFYFQNVSTSILPSTIIKGTRELFDATNNRSAARLRQFQQRPHVRSRDEILSQALLQQQRHHEASSSSMIVDAAATHVATVEAAVATRRMELLLEHKQRVLLQQQQEDILIDAAIRQRQYEAKVKGMQIEMALNVLQQTKAQTQTQK